MAGDESHYVFKCSSFDSGRDMNLPFICKRSGGNCIIFANLFNVSDNKRENKDAYVNSYKKVLETFKTLPR